MKEVWKETREWRRYWNTSNLFKAFFFSFVFSLFDMGTDFNFAWSVPSDCPTDQPPEAFSPCGILHPKQVELFTYFFIGAPAFWSGFAVLSIPLKQMILQCSGGQVHRRLSSSAGVFALLVQISVINGVFYVAAFYPSWEPEYPSLAQGFTYLLKVMAYLSATCIIGVKFVGLFSHGPETKRLVFQTTDLESRCRVHCNLTLSNIFLTITGLRQLCSLFWSQHFSFSQGVAPLPALPLG